MLKLARMTCKGCGARYLQADFLPHRVAGYCTAECSHHEPPGKPTPEDIGWRTGIAAASQRRQVEPGAPVTAQAGRWTFDMVQYPHPIGWQIENWRPVEAAGIDRAARSAS